MLPRLSRSLTGRRFAHAAAAAAAEARPASGQVKGKERAHDYQFPTRGRHGGPPDPYEILGLDRSASDRDIKQQCERAIVPVVSY
jgi:hypothetical protein